MLTLVMEQKIFQYDEYVLDGFRSQENTPQEELESCKKFILHFNDY